MFHQTMKRYRSRMNSSNSSNQTIQEIGTTRDLIVLGDLNGKLELVGTYEEANINDNGEQLVNLCTSNELKRVNFF